MGNWKFQLGAATFLLWAAASPGAYAACEQRLIEPFSLVQSNGFEVEARFYSQNYWQVGGSAQSYSPRQGIVKGEIPLGNGKLTGNHLHFLVVWKNGTVGIYDADIDDQGRLINGTSYDRDHPRSRATWTTDPVWSPNVRLKCCVPRPGVRGSCVPGR
jgi:hypothetical protein